jgi:hypothetical protein
VSAVPTRTPTVPLHVRGIVAASAAEALAADPVRAELDEVGGGPTRVVEHDGVAVLATEVDEEEVLPSRTNLLAHTRVLEVATDHTTIVPMRFGTVVPDEATLVERFLTADAPQLRATLARLDGHRELRLRARYDESAVVRAVLADDPKATRLQGRDGIDDRIELGERIVAGIADRRERDRAAVIEVLAPHAAAVEIGEVTEPLDAFVLSFLVAADALDGFDARVEALAEAVEGMLMLELIGPMPPFSFAAEA